MADNKTHILNPHTKFKFLTEADTGEKSQNDLRLTHVMIQFDIPDWFVEECKEMRKNVEATGPYGHLGLQFRLWPNLADYMMKMGHDYTKEPIEDTKNLLRKWGLDVFIIDNRRV